MSNSLFGNTKIPLTYRAMSKDEALHYARGLAVFLQDATETMATHGTSDEKNGFGLYICFNLLTDYLDIAAGEYDSFMSSISGDDSFKSDKTEGKR